MNRTYAILVHILSCMSGLWLGSLIFQIPLSFGPGLLASVWLFIFYLCLRPLMQLLILPLNLLVLGLLTLVTDALLVQWAAAWTPHLSFTYGQAFVTAACIGLCRLVWGYPIRRTRRPSV